MNDIIILNVYDDDDNVVKTSVCVPKRIKFGAVRKIMKILNVDDLENTSELLQVIYGSWEAITETLSRFFPDMTDEDWNGTDTAEVLEATITIVKYSMTNILKLPKNPKN